MNRRDTMNQRIEQLFQWMKRDSIDAAWITSSENVYYLTGCYVEPHERLFGLFLFAKGDAILIFPKMERATVRNAAWKHTTISYDDAQDPWRLFQSQFDQDLIKINTMAIEKESIVYSRVEQLMTVLPKGVEMIGADHAINQIRMIKDQDEIKNIQEACQLADEAMQIGVASIKEGCTELDIVAKIEFEMKRKGIQEMAFQTIVLFGEKTALPHGRPDRTRLKEGDLILIDLGVRINGYCSDLTRTFAFQSVTERQKKMMETVLQAQQAALRHCKPQTQIGDIDHAARSIITQAGWGEYFIHRTGHGLGLGIHEYPSISGDHRGYLQPGMVITIEPGIYIPKVGGVRVEDDVYISDDGYQRLTQFPRNFQILE